MLFFILSVFTICYQANAFGIGSLVYFDASNASISTKQYRKARELARKLNGRIVKIVGQTINSHNHSKWVIQSTDPCQPITKLRVREKHLLFPEIAIRDVSKLSDEDTVRVISEHTLPLSEATSTRRNVVYFGIRRIFPLLLNSKRSCLNYPISAMTIDTIIDRVKHALISVQGQSHLDIFLSNQDGRIDISELNERMKTFARSSIRLHDIREYKLSFHFPHEFDDYNDWRALSLSCNKDKIIVFGCDFHSHDEYDRIVSSEFAQYDNVCQLTQTAEAMLMSDQDSAGAIRQLFWIKSSWMESVYKSMEKDMTKRPQLRRQLRFIKWVHKRSCTAWHKVSKTIHELCVKCGTEEEYETLFRDEKGALEEKEADIMNEIGSIWHADRIELVKWMVATIQKKCGIYKMVHGSNGPVWEATTNEIIKQFMVSAQGGGLDAFHVVLMNNRFGGEELDKIYAKVIAAVEKQTIYDTEIVIY